MLAGSCPVTGTAPNQARLEAPPVLPMKNPTQSRLTDYFAGTTSE